VANVTWKKLGQVNPKGDLYLLVIFAKIMMRQELKVEGHGNVLLTAPNKMLDDMEDVFNGDLPFDSVAKTDSFRNRWGGRKGAVLECRQIGKTKSLGKVGLTKIVKTQEFGSNTGSGAGAKATEMFESASAWMTALAYANGKVLDEDMSPSAILFANVKSKVDTTASMEDTFTFLNNNPDWLVSCIKTANVLYSTNEFKNPKFHFYRGKNIVNIIENHFKTINKNEGRPFSNLNKWTPADMYMCDCDFDRKEIKNTTNFAEINDLLMKKIKAKKLIGVSLKGIGQSSQGSISKKNFKGGPAKTRRTFSGMRAKSLFGSMDVYFTAAPNNIEVQFRATDTAGKTWQGEVMGESAKHGKIGGGVLDNVLKAVLGDNKGFFKATGKSKTSQIAAMADDLSADILKLATDNKDIFEVEEDISLLAINGMSKKWKFAKYMGLVLADIMRTASDTDANEIATRLYLYATSESDQSAPYIKVS